MSKLFFEWLIALLGGLFALAFTIIILPPLIVSGDIVGALAAGFVNPYASGYSLDTIFAGLILIAWIIHERHARDVKFGWVAILLCFLPGVATALAFYLLLRTRTRAGATREG